MTNSTFSLKNKIAEKNGMYSVDGAKFQEYALSALDYKGSKAHQTIGSLVTSINKREISVADATSYYNSLLVK